MQLRDITDLKVPAARMADLVTTESKDEVLVYDQAAHHIHHLNPTVAAVWRLCDGHHTVGEIVTKTGIEQDAVKLALRQLEDAALLEGPLVPDLRGTHTRRAFMKRAAAAGVIAMPAIISISAPVAAEHNSNHHPRRGGDAGEPCITGANCKSGFCSQGGICGKGN